VFEGEIQCRALAMQVDIYDEDGHPLTNEKGTNEKGELVCAAPFPSMPIGFWNDADGRKYHDAYFARFPNVWCHGDYAELTPRGGVIIYGRSDAVLNPGGVRIGNRGKFIVKSTRWKRLQKVLRSVRSAERRARRVFVRLRPALTLDDALKQKIRAAIRGNTTPRHVPRK